MSVWKLEKPLSNSATPGTTKRFAETSDGSTGKTSRGSCVALSSTDAYAVTLPVSLVTETSSRPSAMFGSDPPPTTAPLKNAPSCCGDGDSNGLSGTAFCATIMPLSSNSVTTTFAACPSPSASPRLVRYDALCATCCSEITELLPLLKKFAIGSAGMYCPKVPVEATAYVRLEATVAKATLTGVVFAAKLRGLISTLPIPTSPSVPEPNQSLTRSFSAKLCPAATLTVTCLPDVVTSMFDGVKVRS